MTSHNQFRFSQGAVLRILMSGLLLRFSNGCVQDLECCAPGTLQKSDSASAEKGSFCTDKPFEAAYKLRNGKKAPMQLNLVDYCTDEVLFTSYFAPTIDKFSLVHFPCTFEPVDCSKQPEAQQEACQAGTAVWQEVGCQTDGKGFFHEVVKNRICNEDNYPEDNTKGYKYYPFQEGDAVIPASKGGCNCDWDLMKERAQNKTKDGNITTGVPDNFIRRGMSTFYVQVVIGGRTTSANDDPKCQCNSPQDTSKECMCALGTRKVPYIYNNSALPYLTALVSMKNGQLIFKKTYINYNWEANGIGCVGCDVDYCWSVPKAGVEGLAAWGHMGYQLEDGLETKLMCGIRLEPNPEYGNEPYCQFPQNAREIDACSLKVYIAWVGTDGYGRACTSSNEMFSKFTQMGVSNVAVDFYNGFSNIATTVDQRITGRSGS